MENSQQRKFLPCLRRYGRYWPVSSTPEAGHFVCHIFIAQFRCMYTPWGVGEFTPVRPGGYF